MPASASGGSAPCTQQQAPSPSLASPGCFRFALTDGARRDAARWAAAGPGTSSASAADLHACRAAGSANTVAISDWGLRLLAFGGSSVFRGAPLLASISLTTAAGAGAGAGGAGQAAAPAPVAAGAAAGSAAGWAARATSGATSSPSSSSSSSTLRSAQPLFSLADATANGGSRRGGRQQQQLQQPAAAAGADADLDIAGAEALLKEMLGQGGAMGGSSSGSSSKGREALPSASRAVRWAADAAAAEGAGGGFMDGGDEEDDQEAAAEAERALARVQCGFCGRSLGRRGARSSLLCDCCHRPFHADCCRYRGVTTRRSQPQAEGQGGGGGRGVDAGSWFHSPDCAAVSTQWSGRAAAGPQPAAASRTWLLLPTQLRGGSSSQAEARDGLQQAAGVLAGEYGPRVVDAVLDSDWAVLLRDPRGTAVSAATLDVYGREVVVMDLVATAEQARGQGHTRALLDAVADWLTEADIRQWVVALPTPASASPLAALGGDGGADEDEAAAARRLQRQYSARGFRKLPRWQQRDWARQLPGFPERQGGVEGSLLMVRPLPAAKGQRRSGEREGGEEEAGGRGRGGAVVGLVRGVAGGVGGAVRGLWGYVTLGGRQ